MLIDTHIPPLMDYIAVHIDQDCSVLTPGWEYGVAIEALIRLVDRGAVRINRGKREKRCRKKHKRT
jgi:hypothetical protein